jgi:hypothetical protein
MKYASMKEGRQAGGLRLVLSQGVPGPWGEAAKAIFKVKALDYLAVAQEGGGENAALRDWTGQSSAPVAVWQDEPPRTDSLDILFLAERLAPAPRLIPEDVEQRARMFGITREIIGRRGLGWMRRIMIFAPIMGSGQAPESIRRMAERYAYRDDAGASRAGRGGAHPGIPRPHPRAPTGSRQPLSRWRHAQRRRPVLGRVLEHRQPDAPGKVSDPRLASVRLPTLLSARWSRRP